MAVFLRLLFISEVHMKLTAKPRIDNKLKKVSPENLLRYEGKLTASKQDPPKQRLSRVDRAVQLATYFCNANEQKRKAKLRSTTDE